MFLWFCAPIIREIRLLPPRPNRFPSAVSRLNQGGYQGNGGHHHRVAQLSHKKGICQVVNHSHHLADDGGDCQGRHRFWHRHFFEQIFFRIFFHCVHHFLSKEIGSPRPKRSEPAGMINRRDKPLWFVSFLRTQREATGRRRESSPRWLQSHGEIHPAAAAQLLHLPVRPRRHWPKTGCRRGHGCRSSRRWAGGCRNAAIPHRWCPH